MKGPNEFCRSYAAERIGESRKNVVQMKAPAHTRINRLLRPEM